AGDVLAGRGAATAPTRSRQGQGAGRLCARWREEQRLGVRLQLAHPHRLLAVAPRESISSGTYEKSYRSGLTTERCVDNSGGQMTCGDEGLRGFLPRAAAALRRGPPPESTNRGRRSGRGVRARPQRERTPRAPARWCRSSWRVALRRLLLRADRRVRAVPGGYHRVLRQCEQALPDRLLDRLSGGEGAHGGARPALEQGVAGEHGAQLLAVVAGRSGGVARGVHRLEVHARDGEHVAVGDVVVPGQVA